MRQFCTLLLIGTLVAPVGVKGQAQATASLTGTVTNSAGQPLSNAAVQLRNLATNQVVANTTSSRAGRFSFVGVMPGSYVVEVVNTAGRIVGVSGIFSVAAGTALTGVIVTASAVIGAVAATGAATGISTALIIVSAAAAEGIVGVALATGNPPSPSR